MAKNKIKVVITREARAPSTTVVCNLKEQTSALPWVFKAGNDLVESKTKDINKLFNERKEWLRPMAEFVITHTSYSPNPEQPFGYDNLQFAEAIELIVDALREEYRCAIGKPNQKRIGEETSD